MNQMRDRGWDKIEIEKTIDYPYTTRISKNKANGNFATVFYNEKGAYIVVDDIEKCIIQLSNNINPEIWIPDDSIINPYLVKGARNVEVSKHIGRNRK